MHKNIVIPFAEWLLYYENVDVNNKDILSYLTHCNYDDIGYGNKASSASDNMYILSDMKSVKEKFTNIIEEGIKQFGYTNKVNIETSWGTLTKTNGYSEFHHHPNYWLSAVYYPSGEGEIEFLRPQVIPHSIEDIQHFTINNSCIQKVKGGDLVIFPSYLRHRIYYYKGVEDRYSIAMNINPLGKIGFGDSQKEKL